MLVHGLSLLGLIKDRVLSQPLYRGRPGLSPNFLILVRIIRGTLSTESASPAL
jgi:hypothetical protein